MLAFFAPCECPMNHRFALLFACALLGGCATSTSVRVASTSQQPAVADDRYEAVAGREAEVIEPLRAAPAPAQAEILPGRIAAADQEQLTAQSYVLVGRSWHYRDDASAHEWIAAQAAAVGADKVRWYAATTAGGFNAAYFVRLRLVFGASFRDLNAQEKARFGPGVRLGEIVGDSPASRANLREADVVVALDGAAVTDRAAFQKLLREHMGKVVELKLSRNGEALQRKVKLGRSFAATP